jgi:Protein of unknown function (DUF3631)
MSDDPKILGFPKAEEVPPEERAHRLKTEVDELARKPETEWLYYLERGEIAKKHGIETAALKKMIEATIKANEKKAREDKAEDRQRVQRVEKDKVTAQRERAKEQARADKEAARKQKEKDRAFATIMKLPSVEQEARLAELAKRLDEDLEVLRDEFAAFVGTEDRIRDIGHVEPWDEPVDTQALLVELITQTRRYVVVHDDVAMAVSLWTMFAWVHNEIAVYSPNLVVTSAEADSGKTTLLGVLGLLTPRPYSVVEPNAANVFRIIDRTHSTFIVDEADQLFRRKPDLKHIVNAGWTRGMAKIPRMVHGVIREFDVFCPKIVGMKGLALDATTLSRSIVCKLWPKLPHEKVSDFGFTDDDAFLALRRKLARWRDDNLPALRDATPILPSGFGNRLAANWKLLLAIAELAGEDKRAREAAVRLSRKRRQVSDGLRLLAALQPMVTKVAKHEVLASAEIVKQLAANPDSEWCDFRNRGPISQKQVATLLAEYEIFPDLLRAPGQPRTTAPIRGYRAAQFDEVFARYLSNRTTVTRQATKRQNAGK